jgi:hypothetical protein
VVIPMPIVVLAAAAIRMRRHSADHADYLQRSRSSHSRNSRTFLRFARFLSNLMLQLCPQVVAR